MILLLHVLVSMSKTVELLFYQIDLSIEAYNSPGKLYNGKEDGLGLLKYCIFKSVITIYNKTDAKNLTEHINDHFHNISSITRTKTSRY